MRSRVLYLQISDLQNMKLVVIPARAARAEAAAHVCTQYMFALNLGPQYEHFIGCNHFFHGLDMHLVKELGDLDNIVDK